MKNASARRANQDAGAEVNNLVTRGKLSCIFARVRRAAAFFECSLAETHNAALCTRNGPFQAQIGV
jgi:hypothetical protein